MKEPPLRRLVVVLALYGVAALILLPALDALARVLLLPPLFGRLVRLGLLLGVPVAAVLAWKYPDLGGRERG